jgi:hypothetical protein
VLTGLLDKDPQRRWDVERTRGGLRAILAGSAAAAVATAETSPLPQRSGPPAANGIPGQLGQPGIPGAAGTGGPAGGHGPLGVPYPGAPVSGGALPGQQVSGHPMSGQPMPGQQMSGPPMSGQQMSGQQMSGPPMSVSGGGYPPNATQAMPAPMSGGGQPGGMRPGRAQVGVPQQGGYDQGGYDQGGYDQGGYDRYPAPQHGPGQAGDTLLSRLFPRRRLGPLLFAAGAGVVALVLVLVAVGAAAGWFSGGGSDKKHAGATPTPTNVQVYTDPHGFTVDLPKSWTSQQSSSGTYFVQFNDPSTEDAWIRTQMDNAGQRSAESFLRGAANGLAGNKSYRDFQQVALDNDVQLGGHQAAQLEYTLTVPGTHQHRHALWRATVSGGKVYEVYMSVPETAYAQEKPNFEQAVKTFKFN